MLISSNVRESRYAEAPVKWLSFQNEICRVCQASLLTFSELLLSYQSALNGCEEHSILENGQFVHGYVYTCAVNISLGYSNPEALIAAATSLMLLFSLISRGPYWTLPFIVFYLANLISDLANFAFFLWILLVKVPSTPALFYTSSSVIAFRMFSLSFNWIETKARILFIMDCIVVGRLWLWLGTLRLFEQRLYE